MTNSQNMALPESADISQDMVAEMIRNGYKVQLVKKGKSNPSCKQMLWYPLFPSVHVAGRDDDWNMVRMNVEIDHNGMCSFKTYAYGIFLMREVSSVILNNVPKGEFDTWKNVALSHLREIGLADETSAISGSILYLRGRNISAIGFLTEIWPSWILYFRKSERFFHSLEDFTDIGIRNSCNNYIIKEKSKND